MRASISWDEERGKYELSELTGKLPKTGQVEIIPPKNVKRNDLLALLHCFFSFFGELWEYFPDEYKTAFYGRINHKQRMSLTKAMFKREAYFQKTATDRHGREKSLDFLVDENAMYYDAAGNVKTSLVSLGNLSYERLSFFYMICIDLIFHDERFVLLSQYFADGEPGEKSFLEMQNDAREAIGKKPREFSEIMNAMYKKIYGV